MAFFTFAVISFLLLGSEILQIDCKKKENGVEDSGDEDLSMNITKFYVPEPVSVESTNRSLVPPATATVGEIVIDARDREIFDFFMFNAQLFKLEVNAKILTIISEAVKSAEYLDFFLRQPIRNDYAAIWYYFALKNERNDLIKVLHDNGVNASGEYVEKNLFIAIENDDEIVLKKLLDMGANPNSKFYLNSRSILHVAITRNLENISIILLNYGATVTSCTLFDAFRIGNLKIVDTIINQKAADYWTTKGYGFFLISIMSENLKVVKHLWLKGFKLEKQDGSTGTTLHTAAFAGDNPAIIQFLIDRGANIHAESVNNAFHHRNIEKYPNLVPRLTDLNHPAVTALLYSRKQTMEVLIKNGFNPNTRIFNGTTTLLHLACEIGDIEMAKILMKYSADTNALDCFNKKPLSYSKNLKLLLTYKNMDEFL